MITIDCGEAKHELCIGWGTEAYNIPQHEGRFDCVCWCHGEPDDKGLIAPTTIPEALVEDGQIEEIRVMLGQIANLRAAGYLLSENDQDLQLWCHPDEFDRIQSALQQVRPDMDGCLRASERVQHRSVIMLDPLIQDGGFIGE
jgi:hypothetical protein